MIGFNEGFDCLAGPEDGGFEVIEVEVVGLFKETQLITLLGFDDRGRAGTETTIVDTGDFRVVMRELRADIDVEDLMFFARGGFALVITAVLGIDGGNTGGAAVFFVVVVVDVIGCHNIELGV